MKQQTGERSYTVWSSGEYWLKLTHVLRRGSIVLSLYRDGHLVDTGEVPMGQLIVGSGMLLHEIKEAAIAHAQLNGVWLPKRWSRLSGRGNSAVGRAAWGGGA